MADAQEQPRSVDDIASSMIDKPSETVSPPENDASEETAPLDKADVSARDGDAGRSETTDDSTDSGDLLEQAVIEEDEEGSSSEDSSEDGGEASSTASGDDDILAGIFDTEQEQDGSDAETTKIDTSKLGDDLSLSVTVDGEDKKVTLGELKRRYAGEGAIEKRLQEATEARTKATDDFNQGRQLTEAILKEFGQALFRRTIPMPDQDMLDRDAAGYMKQKALYDQETNAMMTGHQKLHSMMQGLEQQAEQRNQAIRAEAAKNLRQIMPVLSDPVRGPKVRDALISTAREIGFSDEAISSCTDPLIFKTIALAARELRRQKPAKVKKQAEKARTLAAKGTRNRIPANSAKRNEQKATQRARETGSLDDVAASMIQTPKKRGRR